MEKRTKESRKRLHSLILLTAFTAVLLIVSTYAWFTTQKDIAVSYLRGKVEVAEGLEISLDAKKWLQTIDLASTTFSLTEQEGTGDVVYGPYTGHKNHVPTEFLPASTLAETTGISSGVMDSLKMLAGEYHGDTLQNVALCNETVTDSTATNYAGYYAFDIFIKNSSKNEYTYDTLQLNSDASAWVLKDGDPITEGSGSTQVTYAGNAEAGLQNTIRVALARYGTGVNTETHIPSTASTSTILSTSATQEITATTIWEPNSDTHVQNILDNVKPKFDAIFTSGHSYLTALTGNQFFTKAVKTSAIDAGATGIPNVYDWDTETNIDTQYTVQTTSDSTTQPYIKEGVTNLLKTNAGAYVDSDESTEGVQIAENQLFTLAANSVTKLRVYIWIEGQDPDCTNFASYGGGVEVNLGLTKRTDVGDKTKYNNIIATTTTPTNTTTP